MRDKSEDILVHRYTAQGDFIFVDLPAAHKYLNVLSHCVRSILEQVENLAESEVTIYNIQLAVQEICTNIVDHAYRCQPAGRIQVTMTLPADSSRLMIELQDTGRPFDPSAAPEPNLGALDTRGRGLFLIRHLVDEVRYIARDGGCWCSRTTGPWQMTTAAEGPSDRMTNRWRLIKWL